MENLGIYNSLRSVPVEAQKAFNNGRFSGTDINAMWRIKMLTSTFGVVGFGWRTDIVEKWQEHGANDEVKTFVRIHLYVKVGDEWSAPIEGIGGSHYVSKTKNGYQTNDECYKMAYTDALGVACKALGMGADVYWDSDKSKYTAQTEMERAETDPKQKSNEQSAAAYVLQSTSRMDLIQRMRAIMEYKDSPAVKAACTAMDKKFPSKVIKK